MKKQKLTSEEIVDIMYELREEDLKDILQEMDKITNGINWDIFNKDKQISNTNQTNILNVDDELSFLDD